MAKKIINFSEVSFHYENDSRYLFQDFSIDLSEGTTAVLGPNAAGKSSFLLLAGGRLLPEKGSVSILGKDSRSFKSEEEKNLLVSYIYQNLEFESDEKVEKLLAQVFKKGNLKGKGSLLQEIPVKLHIEELMQRGLNTLSKGELQRTIAAFALLYHPQILIMDEPFFALEPDRKDVIMDFLYQYCRGNNISLLYTMHDFDICRKYSDNLLLFKKEGEREIGPTSELFSKQKIEEAYKAPWSALYHQQRESIRQVLREKEK